MTTTPKNGDRPPQAAKANVRVSACLAVLCSLQAWGQRPTKTPSVENTAAIAVSDHSPATVIPLKLPSSDLDLQARKRDELSHLSSVVQYYLSSISPIQIAGSTSDSQYRDEAIIDARQVAELGFQSGRAEANFEAVCDTGATDPGTVGGEEQRLRAGIAKVNQQVSSLTAQRKSLQDQLAGAKRARLQSLNEQIVQIDDAIALNSQMIDALSKILANSSLLGHGGLAGDIDRLQRLTPDLTDSKTAPFAPAFDSLRGVAATGLASQVSTLFELRGTRIAIEDLIQDTRRIEQQANDLEGPLTVMVQKMIDIDPSDSGGARGADPTSQLVPASSKTSFEATSASLKALSATAVPLTQEIIMLERSRANLLAWRKSVDTEYRGVVRSLTLRFVGIAVVVGLLLILGEIWKRLTVRWVHDLRRRRQLMGPRRIVVGSLCALVVFFGCVTQFHSLATVAGFIVAGLAVGLQTILLSVAAYFFIIGRYGVQAGDRMTISGVTGDVVEVDLLRFYLMELAGNGDELAPTGRVVVFNNAVLFQAGTPVYKQMPGIAYTWHEMTISMHPTGACEQVSKTILAAVEAIYAPYSQSVERQHMSVMDWADIEAGVPKVDSTLQFAAGGLQLLVRFPVELDNAMKVDEQVTQAVIRLMLEDDSVKATLSAEPTIKGSVVLRAW